MPEASSCRTIHFDNAMPPLRFHIRNTAEAFDSKLGPRLLDFCEDGFESEGCATMASSPPFLFGSPPCRAQNPLVKDAHFRVQKLGPRVSSPSGSAWMTSSTHSRVKFGNKQAAVRVEGFDCESSRVVSIALNS